MKKADFAIVGLAVMGENLALNIESRGWAVGVYNRTVSKVDNFMAGRGAGKNFVGARSVEELCDSLETPRKIMLMVKAGAAVDATIESFLPYLEEGDVIIDGGNSNFNDSDRRTKYLAEKGVSFVGCGVSGGELGALRGPSMMPGGNENAWNLVKDILGSAAAVAYDGEKCVTWIGGGGAGHFVKMVHNGIEYGDMQVICEAYQLMRDVCGFDADKMGDVFTSWNEGDLKSYLIEITSEILKYKDEDGEPLVNKIVDRAGQKGTGKWTGMAALDEGVPLTLIAESVFARCISANRDKRLTAFDIFADCGGSSNVKIDAFVNDLEKAVFAAKLISYSQGFDLIKSISDKNEWAINYSAVAKIWREGCIIRSVFLDEIAKSFASGEADESLMFSSYYVETLKKSIGSLRKVVSSAVLTGVPVPSLSSALAYFDSLREKSLPVNLLQAQRDYFGAHTYERLDDEAGKFFHTDWTGEGGDTASSTYSV